MKRMITLTVVALLSLVLVTGCVYTNIKTPFDNDLNKTTLGNKEGRADRYSVMWAVAWGDGGTAAAAKNGGITTVNHMDLEVYSILFGIYTRMTTIVYGD